MPPFGVKSFRRKEQVALEEELNKPPAVSVVGKGSVGKKKDHPIDYSLVVNLANRIFGFNGWSYSVTEQIVDFVDEDEGKFNIGVSALVKVVLRDGSFREDIGYGFSKGLKCRGEAFAKARYMAARDALKNALGSFGCGLCPYPQQTGKVTDYFSSSQPGKGHSVLSGVKRKLFDESESGATNQQSSDAANGPSSSKRAARGEAVKASGLVSVCRLETTCSTLSQNNFPISAGNCVSQCASCTGFAQISATSLHDGSSASADSSSDTSSSATCKAIDCSQQTQKDMKTSAVVEGADPTFPEIFFLEGSQSPLKDPEHRERLMRKIKKIDLEVEYRQRERQNLMMELAKNSQLSIVENHDILNID